MASKAEEALINLGYSPEDGDGNLLLYELGTLFTSGMGADVSITCCDDIADDTTNDNDDEEVVSSNKKTTTTFKAHRCILAARSVVFQSLLMLESNSDDVNAEVNLLSTTSSWGNWVGGNDFSSNFTGDNLMLCHNTVTEHAAQGGGDETFDHFTQFPVLDPHAQLK